MDNWEAIRLQVTLCERALSGPWPNFSATQRRALETARNCVYEARKQLEAAEQVEARARRRPSPGFDGRCGICNSNAHATAECPPRVKP